MSIIFKTNKMKMEQERERGIELLNIFSSNLLAFSTVLCYFSLYLFKNALYKISMTLPFNVLNPPDASKTKIEKSSFKTSVINFVDSEIFVVTF